MPGPFELLVRNLELRACLSEADRAAIHELKLSERSLEPLTYLVREADRVGQCAILISGFAYRQKITDAGEKQILSILVPGDAVDFQALFTDVTDHSVQMLTRGDVGYVAIDEFESLFMERPNIARAILLAVLAEASVFREWIVNVACRRGKERIAHLLCEIGVRLDAIGLSHNGSYDLPMTQGDLADAVGLSPVHVNRSLKTLEAESFIRRGRGAIHCDNWKGMRELCGFNARYLHLDRLVRETE